MDNFMTFADAWLWLIFVGAGLLFIILELLLGVDTGLDLVFIGTALLIGGLVTWAFTSWPATIIVSALICIVYVFIGRRYIHNRLAVNLEKTNIDTIIGTHGVVLQAIKRNDIGKVKVGNTQWRARADSEIEKGSEVTVLSITGTTLTVEES